MLKQSPAALPADAVRPLLTGSHHILLLGSSMTVRHKDGTLVGRYKEDEVFAFLCLVNEMKRLPMSRGEFAIPSGRIAIRARMGFGIPLQRFVVLFSDGTSAHEVGFQIWIVEQIEKTLLVAVGKEAYNSATIGRSSGFDTNNRLLLKPAGLT